MIILHIVALQAVVAVKTNKCRLYILLPQAFLAAVQQEVCRAMRGPDSNVPLDDLVLLAKVTTMESDERIRYVSQLYPLMLPSQYWILLRWLTNETCSACIS